MLGYGKSSGGRNGSRDLFKVDYKVMEVVRVKLGFSSKLVVNSAGRNGGLCLLWSDGVGVDLLSYSSFHIDVMVSFNPLKVWRFTGFYENPDSRQ